MLRICMERVSVYTQSPAHIIYTILTCKPSGCPNSQTRGSRQPANRKQSASAHGSSFFPLGVEELGCELSLSRV